MIDQKKVQYTRDMFFYWSGKFNLTHKLRIRESEDCTAAANSEDMIFYYNSKKLSKISKIEILEIVLHEIGHLINSTSYETQEEKINSEYFAEQFAVNTIKQYYPEKLNKTLKILVKIINKETTKENEIYQEAYKRIPEVQEFLKSKNE